MKFAKKSTKSKDVDAGIVDGITEDIRKKFLYAEKQLNTQLLDMEDVIRGLFLAVLSGRRDADTGTLFGEHVCMISAPGDGKSLLTNKFAQLFDINMKKEFYWYQFHPFSLMENVCGPFDPNTIDTGLERFIEGFVPTAKIAGFDEIFKAGPIRDVLLMLINERRFQNGRNVIDVPLITSIASSNEYPKSQHDAALWDRFLFRYKIQSITSKDSLMALDGIGRKKWNPDKLDMDEVEQAKEEVLAVNISDTMRGKIADMYVMLMGEPKIKLTTRRYKAIYNVLRASAWLQGRTEVVDADITSAIPCMWLHEDQLKQVQKFVRKLSNTTLDKMFSAYERAMDVYTKATEVITKNKAGTSSLTGISEMYDRIKETLDAVNAAYKKVDDINRVELEKILRDLESWQREVLPFAMKDIES